MERYKLQKSRVPPDKLVAMVMTDNIGNQKQLFYAKQINIKSHQV